MTEPADVGWRTNAHPTGSRACTSVAAHARRGGTSRCHPFESSVGGRQPRALRESRISLSSSTDSSTAGAISSSTLLRFMNAVAAS